MDTEASVRMRNFELWGKVVGANLRGKPPAVTMEVHGDVEVRIEKDGRVWINAGPDGACMARISGGKTTVVVNGRDVTEGA